LKLHESYYIDEEEALDNLLHNYFPTKLLTKSGKALYCLDAMCGRVWQGDKIYDFLKKNYSNINLLGVDIRAEKWCEELINSYNPKNLQMARKNILDTKGEYDLILTLRPNCYYNFKMIEIYSHLNSLLKKDGLLFGATYSLLEMESLQMILEASGFKTDEPAEISDCGLKYGYSVIAKKN